MYDMFYIYNFYYLFIKAEIHWKGELPQYTILSFNVTFHNITNAK